MTMLRYLSSSREDGHAKGKASIPLKRYRWIFVLLVLDFIVFPRYGLELRELAGSVFQCPTGPGLCKLGPAGRVERVDLPVETQLLREVLQTRDGRTIILAAGHLDPGSIQVIDRDGSLLLRRDLINGVGLRAATGLSKNGGIVLCQLPQEGPPVCDVQLPAGNGDKEDLSVFPIDCLYPRYNDQGEATCLRGYWDLKNEAKVVVVDKDGRKSEVAFHELKMGDIRDVLFSSAQRAIVLTARSQVVEWTRDLSRTLSKGHSYWLQESRGDVLFSDCAKAEPDGISGCTVKVYRGEGKIEVLWEHLSLYPFRPTELRNGSILIPLGDAANYSLLLLTSTGGKWISEIVPLDMKGVS